MLWCGPQPAHRGALTQQYVAAAAERIEIEWLPGYAPELNPVEHLWSYLKKGDLVHCVPEHVGEILEQVERRLAEVPRRQLEWSFLAASGLYADRWVRKRRRTDGQRDSRREPAERQARPEERGGRSPPHGDLRSRPGAPPLTRKSVLPQHIRRRSVARRALGTHAAPHAPLPPSGFICGKGRSGRPFLLLTLAFASLCPLAPDLQMCYHIRASAL
jgi:hypothetical protein